MTNLWVTFSTDSSESFSELSGNIIYNVNNLYNFNGNIVDTSSNFIIYELTNNPIQANVALQGNNWKQLDLNNILNPFQGYWLGGINTNLPQIFTGKQQLKDTVGNWISNPIPVANNYGLIENWDVGNVTDMSGMFFAANNFNGNISNWDVGNVTNMGYMFAEASNFNQDLNKWDVGNVTSMSSMFYAASNFNGNISNWVVGNVTNMSVMFAVASNFNGNISNWDVGNVRSMDAMFYAANNFNQDLNEWVVGNVTSMASMFNRATSFNGNISSWNVGNVTNMRGMFLNANSFNQDISNWDVGNVANGNFDQMFKNVTFFTGMADKIYANGTPYNYFRSQTNGPVDVVIRTYLLKKFTNSIGTVLILIETVSNGEDSDFNRIKSALYISNMDDLLDYSFTSPQDPTSRDILSVFNVTSEAGITYYYYNVSGAITEQSYYTESGPYTLSFTKRTSL